MANPLCTPNNWAHWEVAQLDCRLISIEGNLQVRHCCDISSFFCLLCTSEIGTAGKKNQLGLWHVPLHMQSANCHGDEKTLLQCRYREAMSGACNQGTATVTCVPPGGKSRKGLLSVYCISVVIKCTI